MSFQRKALATLLGSLLIIFAAVAYLTSNLFVQSTEKAETSQYELMKRIVEFNIQGLETRALARAELVASLPNVRDMVAHKNRDGLAAEMKLMFEVQRDKFGVDQAQFHLAPAISLLRLNNLPKFGDDLSSYRPIVVAVNKDNVARKGLSISRSGPGVFGVAPVFDRAGKPVGSFEFGSNFNLVLDGIKRAYGLESALFMDEARLKAAAPDLGGDVYSEKNRMGRFIKYGSTNWELLRNLVTDSELSDPSIASNPYTAEFQGTAYGVVAVPLLNSAGDMLGMIITAKDFSPTRSTLGQSLIWLSMFALFGLVFMAGVIIVIVRGAIASPLAALNQRFQSMVNGEEALPIESNEGFYGEIGELAEHYESLRARQSADSGKAGAQ